MANGKNARIVDLGGRMLMFGLIDGHYHPTKGAIAVLFGCKFEFTATPDEIARTLTDYAARNSSLECVIGGRWASGFSKNTL